jgi:hypothetical protein
MYPENIFRFLYDHLDKKKTISIFYWIKFWSNLSMKTSSIEFWIISSFFFVLVLWRFLSIVVNGAGYVSASSQLSWLSNPTHAPAAHFHPDTHHSSAFHQKRLFHYPSTLVFRWRYLQMRIDLKTNQPWQSWNTDELPIWTRNYETIMTDLVVKQATPVTSILPPLLYRQF